MNISTTQAPLLTIKQYLPSINKVHLDDFYNQWSSESEPKSKFKKESLEKVETLLTNELPTFLYRQALVSSGDNKHIFEKTLTEGPIEICSNDPFECLNIATYADRFFLFNVEEFEPIAPFRMRLTPHEEVLSCAKEHWASLVNAINIGERIRSYANAIANVYGFLSIDEACALYQNLEHNDVSIRDFNYVVESFVASSSAVYRIDQSNAIVSERYVDEDGNILYDTIETVLEYAKICSRWQPKTSDELLQYADFSTIQNEHTVRLDQWLERQIGKQTNFPQKEETKRRLREQIIRFATNLDKYSLTVDFVSWLREQIRFSIKSREIERFGSLKNYLHDSFPLPEYNGHCIKDIDPLYADDSSTSPSEIRKTQKVGRNEICPCGSGKKYKHCCGK